MKISTSFAFNALFFSGLTQARRLGQKEWYPEEFVRSLDGDPNQNNCRSTINNGGSGCGGGSDDPTYQGSCTPFPFRTATGSDAADPDFCKSDSVRDFAGADQYSGDDASNSFAVWYDSSQAEDDPNKNYWVIHGCDGSGVQVGDCKGGEVYVEQIGPYSQNYADSSSGKWNGNVVTIENDSGDNNMDAHVATVFQHPGTNKVYDFLWGGWWTIGGNDWTDEYKPWWKIWQNEGVKETSDLGPDDSIFFSVYPWVCNLGSQDLSWYWNAGGSGKPMDPIYGTDCDTGGACSSYAKCYLDNEPYDNNHYSTATTPPVARFYKFTKNGDGTLTGWLLYEKTYEGGDTIADYTGLCDSCDDNCKSNNKDSSGASICFNLQRLDHIPW